MPGAQHRSSPIEPSDAAIHVELSGRLNGAAGFEVAFVGDTAFGESYEAARVRRDDAPILDGRDYSRFVAGVRHLVAGADFTIANLETPLTRAISSPLEGTKRYLHRGEPSRTVEALRELGVRAVSLANNHAADYGVAGLEDTIDALGGGRIIPLGAGRTSARAAQPLILEMHGHARTERLAIVAAYDVRPPHESLYGDDLVGMALNRVEQDNVADKIAELRRQDPDLTIVAFLHWGRNYLRVTKRQRLLARTLIGAGASLIIGHGAHTIQSIERIGSGVVVYSLGNFVFNSPGRFGLFGADPFGFVARLLVRSANGRSSVLRLHPILTNNLLTTYKPRPVSPQDIAAIGAKYGNGLSGISIVAHRGFIELTLPSIESRTTTRIGYDASDRRFRLARE